MLFRRLNWNIVGWFRTVSAISYIVIALGLGAMIYHGFAGGQGFQPSQMLRLGLSFTGGTDIAVTFDKPTTTDAVRAGLASLNLQDERINTAQTAGAVPGTQFHIESQTSFANNSVPLKTALSSVGAWDPNSLSITAIGAALGSEYLRHALEALVIALSIQFLYIAFRFGWNYIFGLVTVIALVRDAAMMIGIYALAGRPADDAFLAAVLTVIGYSVMDTIVILDRIRENTKIMVGVAYDTIVNESIKQTMTRSFNTLATVVITLVALLALGGVSLKNFAFALLVGICSGGYHSIFYSAPLVLVFRKRQLEAAARKRREGLVTADGSARVTAPARNGTSREDIIAARRDRRAKQKSVRNPETSPVRYSKKKTPGTTAEVDPLDAQESGLHDAAFDEGHEEINLNLGELED
ncbi:MAG TPA: protein translocase subunit SecF [Candidatus Baltobacteraceae bacterium]|nr:protein translocase subunit SecF [Candidatus Baltobacteraceae bacterium]